MSKDKKKTYAVLGLGIFGSTIAQDLSFYGHDVIAVDLNMAQVEKISDLVSHAVCLNITDIEQLRAVGIEDVDCAIVATGSRLEDSIMCIMNLRELGVKKIIAKTKNSKYSEVLLKIGADEVVLPENEIGKRLAKRLASHDIIDLFDIDNEYSIVEIHVLEGWAGFSLTELNLRHKFGINVIGVRRDKKLTLTIDPNDIITIDDELIIACKNDLFERFSELERVDM